MVNGSRNVFSEAFVLEVLLEGRSEKVGRRMRKTFETFARRTQEADELNVAQARKNKSIHCICEILVAVI